MASVVLAMSAVCPSAPAQCLSSDRVWNVLVDHPGIIHYYHAIRFASDGTVEKSGHTYNKIAMTQFFQFNNNSDIIHDLCDGYRDMDLYLREEDDRVYITAPDNWHISSSEPGKRELQLFDFNAKPGDTYKSVRADGFMACPGTYGAASLLEVDVRVHSVDTVEIGGRKLRRQYIDKITDKDGESVYLGGYTGAMVQVIETIGIVNYGYPMAIVYNMEGYASFSPANVADCLTADRLPLWQSEKVTVPEPTRERPAGTDGTPEYHAMADGSTHMLWNVKSSPADDGTVGISFGDVRKWRRDGDKVTIIDPAESDAPSPAYRLVNNGRKTALRVTAADGATTDYPLYDLSRDRTESFASLMAEIDFDGDVPVLKSFTPIECRIDSVDFHDHGAKWDEPDFAKCQYISEVYVPSTGETISNDDGSPLFSVLEGVGNVSFPLIYTRSGGVSLNKLRGADGTLLLLGENINMPDPEHKPVSLIREDREWEYVSNRGVFDPSIVITRQKFDGTEEYNGRTYHRLMTVRTTVRTKVRYQEGDEWRETYAVEIDSVPRKSALLREENSKVYMVAGEDSVSEWSLVYEYINTPKSWNSSDVDRSCNEMILYDFSQREGDMVQGCADGCIPVGFRVENVSKMTIDGEKCIVQNIDADLGSSLNIGNYYVYNLFSGKMVEGIGFDGYGTMTVIPMDVTTNNDPYFALNNVYDSRGRVIYVGLNIPVPTEETDGIDGVYADEMYLKASGSHILARGAFSIDIHRLDGLSIYSAKPNGADTDIDTAGWLPGAYIIRAHGPNGTKTLKIIL